MVKQSPDFIDGVPNGGIPIFTLRELRWMNTILPEQVRDGSDDYIMVLPRDLADKVFDKTLLEWDVVTEEASAFKDSAGAFEVMRILQISHLLRRAQASGEGAINWIQTENPCLEQQTPWSVIREGEIDRVFSLLYDIIFDPRAPLLAALKEEDGDV